MSLFIGWSLSIALTGAVVANHRWAIARVHHRQDIGAPLSSTATVVLLFVAHFVESAVFGVGYIVAAEVLDIGALVGGTSGGLRDYLYYSMVTYTSLGLGDVFPVGELRLMSGFEVLTGLLMIGWSAAVLFEETSKRHKTG